MKHGSVSCKTDNHCPDWLQSPTFLSSSIVDKFRSVRQTTTRATISCKGNLVQTVGLVNLIHAALVGIVHKKKVVKKSNNKTVQFLKTEKILP